MSSDNAGHKYMVGVRAFFAMFVVRLVIVIVNWALRASLATSHFLHPTRA